MMEQRPIPGHEPLAPPTPDVARAYLDEIGSVVQRREALIDRRRMARLACVEAVVLAVYLTVMLFSFGTSIGSSFVVLVALFLLWLQFATELRESYGGQPRLSGTAQRLYVVFGLVGVAAVVGGVWLQIAGIDVPVFARFLPGVFLLGVFGGRALYELRRAPQALLDEREPFTLGARWSTAALGVIIGLGIWVAASHEPMFVTAFAPIVMVALLGWSLVAYATDKLPALGAIWQWPQWSAFAISGAALIAVMLLSLHTEVITTALAAALAVGAALLIIVTAVTGGRYAQ